MEPHLDKTFDSIDGMGIIDVPTPEEKQLLISLVYTSTLNESEREEKILEINNCLSYTIYAAMQYKLEMMQTPIEQTTNPSYRQIWQHIKKITK